MNSFFNFSVKYSKNNNFLPLKITLYSSFNSFNPTGTTYWDKNITKYDQLLLFALKTLSLTSVDFIVNHWLA